jgi:hypothetical protein
MGVLLIDLLTPKLRFSLIMAEAVAGIGLASSIVTFVEVSVTVLARIREFRSTTKEIPKVFQDITTQLPLMTDIMTRIENQIQNSSLTADSENALSNVVEGCRRQITMLDELIEKILPATTDSSFQRARKAVASIRKEKDIAAIQKALERYTSTLTLHFSEISGAATVIAVKEGTYYEIPSLQVSQYVERVELLKNIESHFANTTRNAPRPKIVVLLGMGGQGKTQLALEYCRVAKTSERYQAIFWIDASSPNTTSRGFETVAAKISSPRRVFDDIESKIAFVKETLGRWEKPWLMVFDNYDQPDKFKNISAYFPQGQTGSILFTSRHADSKRLGVVIRLTHMTEDEGLELLLRQSGLERNDNNNAEGIKIVKTLGYLPLAIDQAGAYISARKLPLSLFTRHYNERKEAVLKHTPTLWEYRRKLSDDKDETLLSVFTTWELSFQQISMNDDQPLSYTLCIPRCFKCGRRSIQITSLLERANSAVDGSIYF